MRGRITPFRNDRILLLMLHSLIDRAGITVFVETGTYLGFSSYYVAARYPHLRVATIEKNRQYYDLSRVLLKRCRNVRQALGDSAEVLESQLSLFTRVEAPLFWLDAHWYDYLPLPAELGIISQRLGHAIILVDDCAIPGRPDIKFDSYSGRAIDLKLIGSSLDRSKEYQVLVPDYDVRAAYPDLDTRPTLTGYAILFMGHGELAVSLARDPFVRKHFQVLDTGCMWE